VRGLIGDEESRGRHGTTLSGAFGSSARAEMATMQQAAGLREGKCFGFLSTRTTGHVLPQQGHCHAHCCHYVLRELGQVSHVHSCWLYSGLRHGRKVLNIGASYAEMNILVSILPQLLGFVEVSLRLATGV
jgi:hypothetical protein